MKPVILLLLIFISYANSLREFRIHNEKTECDNAINPMFPFSYSKYLGQLVEGKSRTNSNLQDFRHECQSLGGQSKCHICEEIECQSDTGYCSLQLQGINKDDMSTNIPSLNDNSWSVKGDFRHDYGKDGTHFCVFLSGNDCINPYTTNFQDCKVRCFGHGFSKGPVELDINQYSLVDTYYNNKFNMEEGKLFASEDDQQVDLWVFPKNCTELTDKQGTNCFFSDNYYEGYNPGFNPQGYSFFLAGSGEEGFEDGPRETSKFSFPNDLSIDKYNNIFIADTGNHAIRYLRRDGVVKTLAGKGKDFSGYTNGNCNEATFSNPKGLSVFWTKSANNNSKALIAVADTGNHQIRLIVFIPKENYCQVRCLSGLCGNNTLSESEQIFLATPTSGYADGYGNVTRFSSPHRVIFINSNNLVVTDTGNYLLRYVKINSQILDEEPQYEDEVFPLDYDGDVALYDPDAADAGKGLDGLAGDENDIEIKNNDGITYTLAGTIIPGERDVDGNPLPGCVPPCLQGSPGFKDGNLTHSQFYQPVGLSLGPENTLYVTDNHRIRLVELPTKITSYYGIESESRVSTIAGSSVEGHEDGIGYNATFNSPQGITVDSNGVSYTVESGTCHIRRVTPYPLVAEKISCSTTILDIIRPSGCVSYDQPLDKIGRKISRVEGNIQYNFDWPNAGSLIDPYLPDINVFDEDYVDPSPDPKRLNDVNLIKTLYESNRKDILNVDRGKYINNCLAVPPRDKLDKKFVLETGDNLVIDDDRHYIREYGDEGMAILVQCPSTCDASTSGVVEETYGYYSEFSSICSSLMYEGYDIEKNIFLVIVQRYDFLFHTLNYDESLIDHSEVTTKNNIDSTHIPETSSRIFRVESYNISNFMTHTIAGEPNAPLQSTCGYKEGQPATLARFNNPLGINFSKRNRFLYIADTNNHMIRGLSPVCTFICENGGQCLENDVCTCPSGWTGIDCTKPVCDTPCGDNSVCVAPNTCACKPGYGGPNCDQALCEQECHNGGQCTAPNTCTCAPGWFDTACMTPVCSMTCGNGGNCTAPNTCACPSEWTGIDCRIPVCEQTCLNGGFCVAPNTCACPPQYTNYDCSAPVCHQGYFEKYFKLEVDPNASTTRKTYEDYFSVDQEYYPTYKNCDLENWCNATQEFECDQKEFKNEIIALPVNEYYRSINGRKKLPTRCMNIEISLDYKLPFQLVLSNNDTTGHVRYSPFTPYTSNDLNPWRGYTEPVEDHTGPWTYSPDRQIANVMWTNVTQGRYVCANGGTCVAPDVCVCAPGWVGFDCRTPVCEQGYYHHDQETYVSGLETDTELEIFEKYLGNNSYRLDWPYSNPSYEIEYEYYFSSSEVVREKVRVDSTRYYNQESFNLYSYNNYTKSYQGGYRCTIRSDTKYENLTYMFEHPNYYSQYMDKFLHDDGNYYTHWLNMSWPVTYRKSRILDQQFNNISYAYTNEGYRRLGIWKRTNEVWEYGVCLMEFYRNCSDNAMKQFDLESQLYSVKVQDTDLSYRPRITYNDLKVVSAGRWVDTNGQCIDEVIRGCANNGTCVAPNTCSCAPGWTGYDCRIPICEQNCLHNGNCTNPNICTCEKGWTGFDCSIPLCAQECQNGGVCIAPDTCKCFQWENTFRDGRVAGGRPLFQDEKGYPLMTGWTGYDCSVPICVQAQDFILNSDTLYTMGGHGADALLTCTNSETGDTLPRCPQFDASLTDNTGTSFQTGCGWDPYDTGCCIIRDGNYVDCYKCKADMIFATENDYYCGEEFSILSGQITEKDKFLDYLYEMNSFKICGKFHSPRDFDLDAIPKDYGVPKYYYDVLYPYQSNFNYMSNLTSNRFLCGVKQWVQGDYIDDAGFENVTGAGSIYGLKKGRHVRINTPNIQIDSTGQIYTRGPILEGEGVYRCHNNGSCIAPDTCTCTDGYEGFDCKTPLCRHLQPLGEVTGCLNGGICKSKDDCDCVQTLSILYQKFPEVDQGITGWTGTDCSMPMCTQGYYDPFCTDLPQAPGGEGCYRCANGGNCTSPDVCTCAPGWTGYDCKTPVCEVVADGLTRTQLGTVHEENVIAFESDPCGVEAIYGIRGWKGRKYARGNCTQPNQCTCLCKIPYDRRACRKSGRFCRGPWQDDLVRVRNLLIKRGPEFTFGSTDCRFGYEGNVNKYDKFVSCHQTIYLPSNLEENSLILIIVFSILGAVGIILYRFASVRLRQKFMMAKIERRKTRRSSEESIQSTH